MHIFKKNPMAMAVYKMIYNQQKTPVDYMFIDVNERFEEMINRPVESVTGKKVSEIFPEQEAFWIKKYDKVASGEEPVSFVSQNKEANKFYSVYAFSPEPGYFAVILDDITLRKQTEDQLQSMNEEIAVTNQEIIAQNRDQRQLNEKLSKALTDLSHSEAKYRELFEGSRDGIVIINKNGDFIDCNSAFTEMLGYSQEELMKMSIEGFAPETFKDPDRRDIMIRHLGRRSFSDVYEMEYLRKDGTKIPVEIRSHLTKSDVAGQTFIWNVVRDISKRKAAEKTAERNQQRLNDIITHSSEMYYIHNDRNILTFVSPQCKAFLGYTPGEMMINWTRLISNHPVNRKGIESTRIAIETGQRQPPYNLELVKKDGQRIWVEVDESPLKDEQGKVTGIVGVLRNLTREKHALENLRQTNLKLQLAMEAADEWTWEWNLETGELKLSDKGLSKLGYEAGEISEPGTWWQKQVHPEDIERVKTIMNDYKLGKSEDYNAEFRLKRKNGTYIWIASQGRVISYDSHGKPSLIIGMNRNISQYKQAEKELRNKHTELSRIFETIPDAVIYTDTNHRILKVNRSFEKIFGYSLEEVYGKSTELLYPNRESFLEQKRISSNIQPGITDTPSDTGYRRKNGELFTSESYETVVRDLNNELIGIITIVHDISEKKRVEKKMRDYKERIRLTTENIIDIIWQMDDKLVFKYVSPSVKKVLAYAPEEVIGKSLINFVDPTDKERMYRNIKRILHERSSENTNIYRLLCKAGDVRYMEISTSVLYEENGRLRGFTGVARDITRRVQSEEKLNQYRKIVASTNDGIALVDDKYRYRLVNRTYEIYSGKSRTSFTGLPVAEYLGQEIFDRSVKSYIDRALAGENVQYESWFVFDKKGRRYLSINYSPFYAGNDRISGVVAIWRDLTEMKVMEGKLRRLQDEKSMIADLTSEMFSYYDTSLNIIWVNKATSEMLKIPEKEIIGKKCYQLWHQRNEPCKNCPVIRAAQSLKPESHEIQTPDGNYYFLRAFPVLDDRDALIGMIEFAQQITEHKKNQQTLEEKSLQIEQAVASMEVYEQKIRQMKDEINTLRQKLGLPGKNNGR